MKNLKRILVGLLAACLVLTGGLAMAEAELPEAADTALETEVPETVAEPEVTEEAEQPAEPVQEEPAEEPVEEPVEAEPAVEEPALAGTEEDEDDECPHESFHVEACGYDEETAQYQDYGDEEFHFAKYTSAIYCKVCDDCWEIMWDEAEKRPLPGVWVTIEEHSYENGVCERCGHVRKGEDDPDDPGWEEDPEDCEHKNVIRKYYFDFDSATYKAVDNRTHSVTALCLGYEYSCPDCYEYWTEEFPEEETHSFEEEHFYSEGVCVDCGYKNTCEHKNVVDEGWIVEKGGIEVTFQQIPGNDKEHYLAGGSISRYIYCKDCGENLWWRYKSIYDENGGVPFDKPVTEEHYFVNGVCVGCGYVLGQAAEEPELQIDLAGITKTNATSGTGAVKVAKGTAPTEQLYARVTWVYTLSNGDSFAYCAMKAVKSEADTLTFNMVSPKAPYGATLDAVQVALVTDGEADSKGSYEALATAKK